LRWGANHFCRCWGTAISALVATLNAWQSLARGLAKDEHANCPLGRADGLANWG